MFKSTAKPNHALIIPLLFVIIMRLLDLMVCHPRDHTSMMAPTLDNQVIWLFSGFAFKFKCVDLKRKKDYFRILNWINFKLIKISRMGTFIESYI